MCIKEWEEDDERKTYGRVKDMKYKGRFTLEVRISYTSNAADGGCYVNIHTEKKKKKAAKLCFQINFTSPSGRK